MKLLPKSQLKAGFLTFLFLLIDHANAMNKNATKFEWLATESAPKHYPMEIIKGTFIYRGQEDGLYIPTGGTLVYGWGEPISNHLVGEDLKPLPDRLKIVFFSYAEKQFYKGEFDLPYDRILALFRERAIADKGKSTLTRIMAGVAPGGAVAVWVVGANTVEVFFGQAEKIELDPGRAFALPFDSKEESDTYIANQLVNVLTPEERESLKANGVPFGLWARYRNRYDWVPTVTAGYDQDKVRVIFVNGENFRHWQFDSKKNTAIPIPVPAIMSFFTSVNGEKTRIEAKFNDIETMAAFEKLGANGRKVFVEFDPRSPRSQTKVRLYNDKESIELKKVVIKP